MVKDELLPGLIYAQKEFDRIAANVKDYDKYKRRSAGQASAIIRGLINNCENQANKPSVSETSSCYTDGYLKEINDYFFRLCGSKLDQPSVMKKKITTDLMNIYVKWNMIGLAGRNDVPTIDHRINNYCEVIDVYINGNKITSLQWPI